MAQCSPQELLTLSSSFGSLTGPMLQQIQTALLCQILQEANPLADCSVQSLLESSSCFGCLTLPQLYIIQTQLLCEILQAGGGGGQSCLLCGTGPPTEDPDCDCAIYYDKNTQQFWDWDGVAWQPFIG